MHSQFIFIVLISLLLAANAIHHSPEVNYHIRESKQIVTNFRNDSTLTSGQISIKRFSSDYCQLRVDLYTFTVGKLDQQGYCSGGFSAWGFDNSNNVPSVICGANNYQHIYLNFFKDYDIYIRIDALYPPYEYWDIALTQILCDDPIYAAPPTCLQHFPEQEGIIESFDFVFLFGHAGVVTPTYQLSNLDFYACFGSSNNSFSNITFSQGSAGYYFVLTEIASSVSEDIIGSLEVAKFDPDCTTTSQSFDYIEIPDGTFVHQNGTQVTRNQFCGLGFPPSVTSSVKPFRMHVVTNDEEIPSESSVGFALRYELK